MTALTGNIITRQRHQNVSGDASLTLTLGDDARLNSQIAKHITGAPQARRHVGRIMKATHALGSVSAPLGVRARCPRHSRMFPKTQNLISVSSGEIQWR
jgi:hypothetical protein